ncbi:MAG: zinc ribbon domain-containing protein [Chloroflexi bacterium]|nr:MAG: zinc ribbon domain-containing protein [Chloroflexota bacterium]HDN79671.1 zinc ribbon domain-containing protein [Chloroflexota bacterium]
MPIYEYRCQDCGRQVELLVRSEDAEIRCPYCGSSSLEKLLSVPYVMGGRDMHSSEWRTCCGRDSPCDAPPCSSDGICRRGR